MEGITTAPQLRESPETAKVHEADAGAPGELVDVPVSSNNTAAQRAMFMCDATVTLVGGDLTVHPEVIDSAGSIGKNPRRI
jgi:hypothetical protein